MCTNGQDCKFLKENRCSFSHEKEAWKVVESRRHKQKNKSIGNSHEIKDACRNGPSCWFFKNRKCKFSHENHPHNHKRQDSSKKPKSNGQEKGGPLNQLKQCKYGNKCDKGILCGFLHLPTDFLPPQGGRRH